jgi:putative transposase
MTVSDESSVHEERERRPVGRPPKLSAAVLAEVERIAREHSSDSLGDLVDRVEKATGIRVSQHTLRLRLRELGFVRVVPPRKPSTPEPAVAKETGSVAPARYGYGPEHREKAPEALYHFGLSDAEWAIVADIFEDKVRGTPRKYARRTMVDAMSYIVRGGVPWRMLPKEFPPWLLVFKTFQRWSRQGRFEQMYDRLRGMWREREGRSPEPTAAIIDSQSVKTSAQGGPRGFDGAKKVKGRKRHLLTDTLGLLIAVVIQVGSTQDRDGADEVVAAGLAKAPSIAKLYTDEGYAGQCKKRLEASHPGLNVEVARHPGNRSVGVRVQPQQVLPLPEFTAKTFVPLPKRWVIERTNAWNDRPRRMAKDQDRTLASSEAWIWFAEGRRLLRRLSVAKMA